jgi:ribosomal protein S3
MGQKIIPISLRLFKNKNWDTNWNLSKSEYSKFFFFSLELKKYFKKLFNYKYFKLITLKILKLSNNINIYLYIHQLPPFRRRRLNLNKLILKVNSSLKNQYIKFFVKTIRFNNVHFLNENFITIFQFIKKNNFINKDIKIMIYLFIYALATRNVFLISNYIKQSLMKKKYHQRQIKTIIILLNDFFKLFKNFLGFRLQFKGRINGARRKKKQTYQKGKVPLNSLNCNIKYHFTEFNTPSGICSIKLWVFLKKRTRQIFRKSFIKSPIIKKENNINNNINNGGIRKKHVYNRETNFFYQTLKKGREKRKLLNKNNYKKRYQYPIWLNYFLDYRNTTLNLKRPQDFTEEHNRIFNEPQSSKKK